MVKEFTDGKYTAYQKRVKWRKDYLLTIFCGKVFVISFHFDKPLNKRDIDFVFKVAIPEYREQAPKGIKNLIDSLYKDMLGGSDEHTD